METQQSKVLIKPLEDEEFDRIASDIVKKRETFCEFRNEAFMLTKVLCDTTQQNFDTLCYENDQLTPKMTTMKTENESCKLAIVPDDVKSKVEAANSVIARLTDLMTPESELSVYRKELNDLMDELEQLLFTADWKDVHIEHLKVIIKYLMEEHRQSDVVANDEALASLDGVEGKDRTLAKEEKENLDDEIESLRDSSYRNVAETMTLRQELTSTTVQNGIDLEQKTEELRMADSTIKLLTEANQYLTSKCDEYSSECESLREQMDIKCYQEDCAKYEAQTSEMYAAAERQQRLLNETADECFALETELQENGEQHRLDVEAKDKVIAQLRQELTVADDPLQNRMSADMMNRLTNGLTVTEICARYFSLVEQMRERDQDHNNPILQFETMYRDLQEKALEIDRLQVEYKKVVAINEELSRKVNERALYRDELSSTRSKLDYMERENAKLKTIRQDLARQVSCLLMEIECLRGGSSSQQDQAISPEMRANEIISNKLVAFKSLAEMQQNDDRLLLLVRDLRNNLEEMDANSIDIETYEAKCASYEKRLLDAERSRRADEELLSICLMEKERFRHMVCDLMKDCNKPTTGDQAMFAVGASKVADDKKVEELARVLYDTVEQMKELKDEYSEYRRESKNTVESLTERFLAMRMELKELTTPNCKLSTQSNFACNKEINTQQNNATHYKNQIQLLEERCQTQEKTIAKHEAVGKCLRDEVLNTTQKLELLKARCDNLRLENLKLMYGNRDIESQNQLLSRERTTNSAKFVVVNDSNVRKFTEIFGQQVL